MQPHAHVPADANCYTFIRFHTFKNIRGVNLFIDLLIYILFIDYSQVDR